MKKSLVLKLLLITSLFFMSCENELRYKFLEAPEKLVVFCFFSPDSIWKVRVYKMQEIKPQIIDDSFYVSNASVKLFQDNIFIEELTCKGKGIYVSNKNTKPVEGKEYSLVVNAKGFPEVRTKKEMLPHKVQIKLISYVDSVTLSNFYLDEGDYLSLRKGNFYTYKCEIENATIASIKAKASFLDYNPRYSEIDEKKYLKYGNLVPFLEMQNKTDTITFVLSCIPNYDCCNCSYDSIENTKFLELSIYNVDKDYLNFYIASNKQYDEQTSEVGIFYSPTEFYSNMQEGVGIFTGISKATKIKLPYKAPDKDFFYFNCK